MSTKKDEDDYHLLGGIFSPKKEESPLWDANKAFLMYCSSDFHVGQVGGQNKTQDKWSWKFRGNNIVNAFLKHLTDKQGLGDKSNVTKTVVFGGGSAGAVGAMFQLDHVAEQLKPYNVKTIGFLDSPVQLDIPQYNKKEAGLVEIA